VNARRVIVLAIFSFLLFLVIYTWNERTGKWDALGANVGLEVTGGVLRVVMSTHEGVTSAWGNYWDLVDVRQENKQIKRELNILQLELAKAKEGQNELHRLRELFAFQHPPEWQTVGARLLAWRLGSNDFLDSFVVSKGFFNGAKPGFPIIVPSGLMGRVLKAGPYTSIALLITDQGSSVAVVTSEKRVPGIIQGEGAENLLSMRFVKQNETVQVGEILVTSGMDLSYPKGIPVARVVSVEFGADAMLNIKAEPLVVFEKNEEVLLLQNPFENLLPQGSPVYSPQLNQLFAPKNSGVNVTTMVKGEKDTYDILFDDQQEKQEKQEQELGGAQNRTEENNNVNMPPTDQIQQRNN